ncbi:hypothetical protein Aperf_G00000106244 [Anoplocephala perfoliata]
MSETPNPQILKSDQSQDVDPDVLVIDDNNDDQDQKPRQGKRSKKEQDTLGPLHKPTHHKKEHTEPVSEMSEGAPHVMFQLGEHHPEEETRQPPAFVELDELSIDPTGESPPEWREVASCHAVFQAHVEEMCPPIALLEKWIKYEEEVEESADRWSKPHVAVQPLMSVFEVRSCLSKAVMLLDLEVTSLELVAEPFIPKLVPPASRFLRLAFGQVELCSLQLLVFFTPGQLWSLMYVTSIVCRKSGCAPLPMFFVEKESTTDEVVQRMVKKKMLDPGLADQTRDLLLLHHSTLYTRQKRRAKTGQQLHIIRSLAEIGKRHSAKDVNKLPHVPSHSIVKSATNLGVDRMDPQAATASNAASDQMGAYSNTPDNLEATSPTQYDHHFFKKVPQGAEAVNILVGETTFLRHPIAAFVRLREAVRLGEMTEVPVPTRFVFVLLGSQGNGAKYQTIGRGMGTLFSDEIFLDFARRSTSRNDLLAGIDEFLSVSSLLPPAQWCCSLRIDPPLNPPSQEGRKAAAAAAAAAALASITNAAPTGSTDETRRSTRHHLLPKIHHHHHRKSDISTTESVSSTVPKAPQKKSAAVGGDGGDSYPSSSTKDIASLESGTTGGAGGSSGGPGGGPEEFDRNNDPALMRTGRIFGGLIMDIKRKGRWYLSDFTDALHIQCFASFFFLYFACLTPIITFGGLLANATGGYLGTMESIVSGAVVGILYALFAGQPLTIMGSTGPVLVFEGIIYTLCTSNRWSYLSFRFWIGMWVALFLFLMVAFDLSALVRFITRFTEESFALLIALIFIVEAIQKTYAISFKYPVNFDWKPFVAPPIDCRCLRPVNYTDEELLDYARKEYPILDLPFAGTNETDAHHYSNENRTIDWDKLHDNYYSWGSMDAQKQCKILHGQWSEKACEGFYAPDIFFFCIVLAIFCFVLSYGMRSLRNSRFFPSRIRSLIADFAVLIAIIICTLIDYFSGLHTPKLMVPISFEPTLGFNKRGWIIPPFNGNPWWSSLAAIGPALLAVILIFMDQQITSVIVNRRENKLRKGGGYHLDLLIVTLTIAINSVLGIPWFVAATVLSINHVISLKKESEASAPGERPLFLGCREQRVTGFFIFLFIGLSVFMSSLLRLIPMAVLYGVFLLMGITSLSGLQFIERVGLFFTPAKYQPDYAYLRHVRLGRVHLFTAIQILCLVLLYVIKSVPQISILFPLMVLAMCFVRWGLDFFFSQEELYWLDDILPESACSRRRKTETGGQPRRFASAADFSSKDSLPLSQPLILSLEDKPFSVSEEVSKTLIWRQLSGIGLVNQGDDDDKKKRRDRKKKGKRQHRHGGDSGGSGNETSDSCRGSGGRRFRTLRLFSSDFDGAIGRDIAVLFHSNETEQGGGSASGATSATVQPAQLPTPEIKINPPSHQGSPNSSRKTRA